MHKSTKKHITDCNLTYLHIFPFSAKQGTPAARMPQVEKKVIQKRSKELREVGDQRLNIFLINEVGKEKKVLVEKPGFGRTEQYSKVLIPEDNNQGTLITKKIIGINKDQLMAQLN
jgi:threonylcarbamoyladenosine tRNA methylthiotransferase MtaB